MTKEPFSTQISPELKSAVNATVRGLRASVDPTTTLSDFTEEALGAAVRAAEDQHHDSEPWPDDSPLPPGRPAPTRQDPGDSTESL